MQMFMFEAVITNVSEWRSILAAIGNIVEDAMFICNADEVTFRGMDAAHVALLDVSFPKRSFESLKADASMFGIKIEDFKNVLAAASADDKVTLSIEGKDKLSITFSGSLDMKYNLKLLEGREVNTPVPKIEAVSKIKISPDALTRVISNIEKISEHVTIDSNAKRVQFSGKGDIFILDTASIFGTGVFTSLPSSNLRLYFMSSEPENVILSLSLPSMLKVTLSSADAAARTFLKSSIFMPNIEASAFNDSKERFGKETSSRATCAASMPRNVTSSALHMNMASSTIFPIAARIDLHSLTFVITASNMNICISV